MHAGLQDGMGWEVRYHIADYAEKIKIAAA
jgi:hypothetical protein